MEEDEESTTAYKIETIDIECKIEIDDQTEIEVEKESDPDDGSNDSQSDINSTEKLIHQGIKRNKRIKYRNKKRKIEEESSTDDDIEEVQSNDPLDVTEELNDSDRLNDPHDSNDAKILEHFTRWQLEKQLSEYTESVFLTYFKELETRVSPAALWDSYCALKTALSAHPPRAYSADCADINRCHKLKYYIRKVTDGFREKESRVFTAEDIRTFLKTASDETHLVWKVAIIIGVSGGCRCNELRDLTVDDVSLHGDKALVLIKESSKKQRSFVISVNYSYFIKKYLELRPKNFPIKRLLVPCKYNEFSKQAMGKKKIGAIPTGVARFLNLPHADEYTGHTYRRTFALLNPLKQSNTINSNVESDNEIENLDNKIFDYHDNRTVQSNKKVPAKIYKKFLEVHDVFKRWMKEMRVPYIFEDCVLTYFKELAKNYKAMSLWKLFSILRYTLLSKDNIDIRSYKEVTDYLQEKVDRSKERAVGAFCARDVDVFVKEAPDDVYLGTKVALLISVSGACNCQELINITKDNVRIYGTAIIVKLKDSNKKNKIFLIPDNYNDYIKKYIDLRPKDMIFDKFLILFKNGKYTKSVMGKVMLRSVAKDVASYLKVLCPDEYYGHYLKRTAFVLFNLTTISIINDGDDSDNDGNESDNEVENSDNKVERLDKLNIDNDKCSSHIIDATVKLKHNDIGNKRVDTIDNKRVDTIDNKYSSCDLEEDLFEITPDIVEDRNNSKPGWHPRYDEIYNYFKRWLEKKSTNSLNENIMLLYFKELAEKSKPSTLWSQFYVLKRTLIIKNDVDISDYDELKDYLKRKADGFRSTKSRVFTIKEIDDFLEKAPDDVYLHWKVALILGIKGACKCTELLNLKTEHVKLNGDMITISVQETRNRKRKFFISDHYFTYVKKYIDMRPTDCKTNRFLLLIKNKKVIKACVGKNTINNMPKEIANYLNLPFPEEYNGHCFKTTSMTLFSHDALVRSNRQAGHLCNTMGDFSKVRNEANEAVRGKNEAQTATWPENDGKRALCWPLTIENDDEIEADEADDAVRGKNEAQTATWPENDGKRALCWPLTIENDEIAANDAVRRKNEAQTATWPENEGKRALCWPLTIENDDEIEANEANGKKLTLNSENGVFEMVDQN